MEKTEKKRTLLPVWLMFAGFMVVFILNLGVTMSISPTQRMWLVLDIWVVLAGVFTLVKNGLPKRKYILISLVASLLVVVSYIGVSLFSMIKGGTTVMITALAVFSVFCRYEDAALYIDSRNRRGGVPLGVLISVLAGVLLAALNCLLMSGNNTANPQLSIQCFTISLSPAILEEFSYRTFLYAFCVNTMGRKPETRGERFTCLFMMIMPHVAVHTPEAFITGGFMSGMISLLMYALLFGLPFAVLQKRRSIGSAMLAHGIVDCIRFIVFGLPI